MAKSIDQILSRMFSESYLIYSDWENESSDEEIMKKLLNHVDESTSNGLYGVMDHTSKLLSNARNYAANKEHQLACLLYATFFEHEINFLISSACAKKEVDNEEVKQLLFDVKFRAKCTWFLKILGFSSINNLHLKKMNQIFEVRNAFVHYKWTAYNIDTDDHNQEDNRALKSLEDVEKTVTYLKKYINRNIYKNKKRKAKTLLKGHLRKVVEARAKEQIKNADNATNK